MEGAVVDELDGSRGREHLDGGVDVDPPQLLLVEIVEEFAALVAVAQAGRYDAMLDLIEPGRLTPSQLITRTVALAETGEVLAAIDDYRTLEFSVIDRY